jgi:leucyl-tRNA synthetase
LRETFQIAAEAEQSEYEATALALPKIQQYMEGKPAKKIIVVKGKLVNVVVG